MRADRFVVPAYTLKPSEHSKPRVGRKRRTGILQSGGEAATIEGRPGEHKRPPTRQGQLRPGSVWFMWPPPLPGIIYINTGGTGWTRGRICGDAAPQGPGEPRAASILRAAASATPHPHTTPPTPGTHALSPRTRTKGEPPRNARSGGGGFGGDGGNFSAVFNQFDALLVRPPGQGGAASPVEGTGRGAGRRTSGKGLRL